MKTKGANRRQIQSEVNMKRIMTSCYCYGSIDRESAQFKEYILPYLSELPKDVFEDVYKEHGDFLRGCKVIKNTFTDEDGITYNSIEPD